MQNHTTEVTVNTAMSESNFLPSRLAIPASGSMKKA